MAELSERPALSIYRLMTDSALGAAIADLERVVSQDGFRFAPEREREAYLSALARARGELERRAT
jgi:hypothetical protein